LCSKDSDCGTLLHWSCYWNKPKVVLYLLSKNANVTKCFSSKWLCYDGLTALEIAKIRNYNSIVKLINASEEAKMAIIEILCLTKRYLPKELRELIVQTMIFIWTKRVKYLCWTQICLG